MRNNGNIIGVLLAMVIGNFINSLQADEALRTAEKAALQAAVEHITPSL